MFGAIGGGASTFNRSRARGSRSECLVVLLLRNFLFVDQLLVTDEIILGLYVIGFGLLQLRAGSYPLSVWGIP